MSLYRGVIQLLVLGLLAACSSSPKSVEKIPGAVGEQSSAMSALDGGEIKWHLGDQWNYSDGYALRVTNVTDNISKLQRVDKKGNKRDWIEREGLFKVASRTDKTVRKIIYRSPAPVGLFPLAVGKRVAFKREYLSGTPKGISRANRLENLEDKKLRVHNSSWKVVGKERVSVPAGDFDCWILQWNTKSTLSDWSGYEKWWYSPKVGNYVRLEYKYGKKPASSRVLMKYLPADRPNS